MNDEPKNDAAPINGAKPAAPNQQQMAEAMLHGFIWPVLCAALNGIRLSLPQFPIHVLLVHSCGLFGRVVGETMSVGDLAPILKLRKDCIDAFTTGLRQAKIRPPAGREDVITKAPLQQ